MDRELYKQYDAKRQKVVQQLQSIQAGAAVGTNKTTSNLFRERQAGRAKQRLDLRSFNKVLSIDVKNLTAEVEGMTTYEDFVAATLEHGLIPLVVPQLKTITVGGGVAGMAIESSSFKYGLTHEGVTAMEVLLADGEVAECRPDNKYKDLFFGLPNSYGTLGYVLKLTLKLRPALPYVELRHIRFTRAADCFAELEAVCRSGRLHSREVDFVDGVAFGPDELYLTLGYGVAEASHTSDYTFLRQYYRSIQESATDYLTIHDYIWRWDTDWFWCSKNVGADRLPVRLALGRKRLGSKTYSQLMRWEHQHHYVERLSRLARRPKREAVIQDIEVPIAQAEAFLAQFQKEIDIRPVWICPTKAVTKGWPYPLYPMDPKQIYVNFGFWDSVPTTRDPAKGYYNRKVEDMVEALGGMKSLYSTSFYSRARFEKLYNYAAYAKLKKRYDPTGRFKGLYEKCVERA